MKKSKILFGAFALILSICAASNTVWGDGAKTKTKNKQIEVEIVKTEVKTEEQKVNDEIIQPTKEVEELQNGYLGEFELTAYCITGTTATGTYTTENRTIAVDPTVIPLGSTIQIEGYGTYIAEDTGGVVKGNIIDIYIPGYQNCINFGRRKADVYLVN